MSTVTTERVEVCCDFCDAPSVTRAARGRPARRCADHMSTLPADDPRHGTVTGFANHSCRCDGCSGAYREYKREKRNGGPKVTAAPLPQPERSADPPVRPDALCAVCGKPRKLTDEQRRYAGGAAERDPFCSARCCRTWWGCTLAFEKAPAPGRPREKAEPAERKAALRAGVCLGCGGTFEAVSPGCRVCLKRSRNRADRASKRVPVLACSPTDPGVERSESAGGGATHHTTAGGNTP